MRRKIALLIAIVIIVCMPASYFLWFLYIHQNGAYVYEREIVRKPADLQEAIALAVAEYSGYSEIFGKPRLTPSPDDPMGYTWANFIDAEVVQYYNDRFDNFTEKVGGKPKEIEFRYRANVFTWDQIRVVYVPDPEGTSSYDSKIQVQSSNGSVLLENALYHGPGWGMEFAQWNGSEHYRISADEINCSLSKSYVVEMSLEYSEIWGPLAAFFVDAYQIIVVDENFVPSLLCVQAAQLIS